MKRTFLLVMVLASASVLAACFKAPGPVTYLVNSNVTSVYPKLKPGTVIQNVHIESVDKVLPGYTGWLPAIVAKVNQQQAEQCKKLGYELLKGCDGALYCVYPAPNAPIYFYKGNYTELLVKLNVTRGLGNPKAKLWIVELLDPFCPYCALFYKEGGGDVIQSLINSGKAYLIPIVVAFHKNSPAYMESVRLAYEQNQFVEKNETSKFFKLEHEIAKNIQKLFLGKMKLSKVNLPKEVLMKANEEKLQLAQKLFPYVATPGNVFVDRRSGSAIAVMGALRPQGVMTVINMLYGGKWK